MPDLDEDKKDFQEIPIEAVIKSVQEANELLDKAQKQLRREVKKAFPTGTIIQRGKQTYEVVGYGFSWSNPGRIRLANTSNFATINIDVTEESEFEKLRILKHPEV